jgi:hypothetical protein
MRKPTRFEDVRRRATPAVAVPAGESHACDTAILSADDSVIFHRHQFEQDIRHRLMAESNLNFTSLVVRRVRDGLCLEGVLELEDGSEDVNSLVRHICGATPVLNHLVVHRTRELPRKG